MKHFKFKKLPASIGVIRISKGRLSAPNKIYEYAKSFRGVYTRAMPMLVKIIDTRWATQQEVEQLHGKAQSLAVQIAMSNELLLKAILLGSTGKVVRGHNLKELVERLDDRYLEIIKEHFSSNGLKKGRLNKVLSMSSETFIDARYGFEDKQYDLDFMTLQLLNEALDNIYNNYLPDWTRLTKEQQNNSALLEKEVDLIFDEDYQKEQAKQLKFLQKAFKDI